MKRGIYKIVVFLIPIIFLFVLGFFITNPEPKMLEIENSLNDMLLENFIQYNDSMIIKIEAKLFNNIDDNLTDKTKRVIAKSSLMEDELNKKLSFIHNQIFSINTNINMISIRMGQSQDIIDTAKIYLNLYTPMSNMNNNELEQYISDSIIKYIDSKIVSLDRQMENKKRELGLLGRGTNWVGNKFNNAKEFVLGEDTNKNANVITYNDMLEEKKELEEYRVVWKYLSVNKDTARIYIESWIEECDKTLLGEQETLYKDSIRMEEEQYKISQLQTDENNIKKYNDKMLDINTTIREIKNHPLKTILRYY